MNTVVDKLHDRIDHMSDLGKARVYSRILSQHVNFVVMYIASARDPYGRYVSMCNTGNVPTQLASDTA